MWDHYCVFYLTVTAIQNAVNLCGVVARFRNLESVKHVFVVEDSPVLISYWGFVLLQLYFYTCLFLKLKPDVKNNWLHQLKNIIFYSLIIPINLMTSCGFWMVFLYDRNCILPPILDSLFPSWANHIVHSLPPFVIGVEMYFSHDSISCKTCSYLPSKKSSFVILNIVLIAYLILFLNIYFAEGRWVYFGMQYLSTVQIVTLITTAYLGCIIFHLLGYYLHSFIAKHRHRSETEIQVKKK